MITALWDTKQYDWEQGETASSHQTRQNHLTALLKLINQRAICGLFNLFQNLYRKCKRHFVVLGQLEGIWGLKLSSSVRDEGLNPTDTEYTSVLYYTWK